jgi:hypothetical protein
MFFWDVEAPKAPSRRWGKAEPELAPDTTRKIPETVEYLQTLGSFEQRTASNLCPQRLFLAI